MVSVYSSYNVHQTCRTIPKKILVDGVNIAGLALTESTIRGPFSDWRRRWAPLLGGKLIFQQWVFLGEVIHQEIISAETSVGPSQTHVVNCDCSPNIYIGASAGIGWSAGERVETLWDQGGDTSYDGQYDARMLGKTELNVDDNQTGIPSSVRRAQIWPPFMWTRQGHTKRSAAFMDEWLRLQLYRYYQWPDTDGSPRAVSIYPVGQNLTTSAINPPVNPGGQYGGGTNPWTGLTSSTGGVGPTLGWGGHNLLHFTVRQLACIYYRTGWPRAVDQFTRCLFSAIHTKYESYWEPKANQQYGDVPRVVGWMFQAFADGLELYHTLGVEYANEFNKVLAIARWHVDYLYGGGPSTWVYDNVLNKYPASQYPVVTFSSSGGHISTTFGFRIPWMEAVIATGLARLWKALHYVGLGTDPTTAKVYALGKGTVDWIEASGWDPNAWTGGPLTNPTDPNFQRKTYYDVAVDPEELAAGKYAFTSVDGVGGWHYDAFFRWEQILGAEFPSLNYVIRDYLELWADNNPGKIRDGSNTTNTLAWYDFIHWCGRFPQHSPYMWGGPDGTSSP